MKDHCLVQERVSICDNTVERKIVALDWIIVNSWLNMRHEAYWTPLMSYHPYSRKSRVMNFLRSLVKDGFLSE